MLDGPACRARPPQARGYRPAGRAATDDRVDTAKISLEYELEALQRAVERARRTGWDDDAIEPEFESFLKQGCDAEFRFSEGVERISAKGATSTLFQPHCTRLFAIGSLLFPAVIEPAAARRTAGELPVPDPVG